MLHNSADAATFSRYMLRAHQLLLLMLIQRKKLEIEVLYFVQNKCHALTLDKIASIYADFFTCVETESARAFITDID